MTYALPFSIQNVSADKIIELTDDNLCEELDKLCPVLSSALKGAAGISNNLNEKFGPCPVLRCSF